MNIRPVGAELFRVQRLTDVQTDAHDQHNSRFSKISRTVLNNEKLKHLLRRIFTKKKKTGFKIEFQ